MHIRIFLHLSIYPLEWQAAREPKLKPALVIPPSTNIPSQPISPSQSATPRAYFAPWSTSPQVNLLIIFSSFF